MTGELFLDRDREVWRRVHSGDLVLAQMVMIGATHGPVSDIMDNAYMVGASVGALCPEYSSVVDNYEW